jgi:glutamate---cysteine ligase / carboxylate-amine ligase
VRRPELGMARTALTRRIIDENRWRAKRFGLDARFIDEHTGEAIECARVLDAAIQLVSEDAHQFGCEESLRHLGTILDRGSSAHEQLALYRHLRDAGSNNADALRAVVDWLAETSVPASAV